MALVDVRHLSKHFVRRHGLFTRPTIVRAVEDVSLTIDAGDTFGLVGESGSGKTTTARSVLRLIQPTSGEVWFRGQDILALAAGELRDMRRHMQIVFQDPQGSLNPRMRVGEIVREPLDIHRLGSRGERRDRVAELLTLVGVDPSMSERYPREFSGGQRQRIGLARALALSPTFLIADEPVSALDVSVQAQIVNLLLDLQARLGLTYLLIAHDLRLVEQVCTRMAVMYRGRIVEMGATAAVFAAPKHTYTQALLSAIPLPDPSRRRQRIPFDERTMDLGAVLRPVGEGHFAAI